MIPKTAIFIVVGLYVEDIHRNSDCLLSQHLHQNMSVRAALVPLLSVTTPSDPVEQQHNSNAIGLRLYACEGTRQTP